MCNGREFLEKQPMPARTLTTLLALLLLLQCLGQAVEGAATGRGGGKASSTAVQQAEEAFGLDFGACHALEPWSRPLL